jgi:hypothetical protein
MLDLGVEFWFKLCKIPEVRSALETISKGERAGDCVIDLLKAVDSVQVKKRVHRPDAWGVYDKARQLGS